MGKCVYGFVFICLKEAPAYYKSHLPFSGTLWTARTPSLFDHCIYYIISSLTHEAKALHSICL